MVAGEYGRTDPPYDHEEWDGFVPTYSSLSLDALFELVDSEAHGTLIASAWRVDATGTPIDGTPITLRTGSTIAHNLSCEDLRTLISFLLDQDQPAPL
jgi:hypothetical protein